jgi:hypothetical protein
LSGTSEHRINTSCCIIHRRLQAVGHCDDNASLCATDLDPIRKGPKSFSALLMSFGTRVHEHMCPQRTPSN